MQRTGLPGLTHAQNGHGLRHLAFEDLGCFEPVLSRTRYKVHDNDIRIDELWTLEPVKPELIIVLGGPVGAYEDDKYL